MKITVCIGSYCHLKGARRVAARLEQRIQEENMQDRVQLAGCFCQGNCAKDVSVTVDDQLFSVSPDDVDSFFAREIATKA